MTPIYLDYNATTPIDPRVADVMMPFLTEQFGNPSSSHPAGEAARRAVDLARSQVAGLLGCAPDEVVFTSGGSEANNHAIKGAAWGAGEGRNHLITSAVEHPAVSEVYRHLAGQGFEVTTVPVDSQGQVDPAAVERALTDRTALVSVMHANNEVGTLQPVADIAEAAHRRGALVHCDCAQSVGKVPVVARDLGVDLLSVAGHKLYAPKGVGALYIRSGVELVPLIHGADHEQGRRAGTESLLLVVGLGRACELAGEELADELPRLAALRDRLEAGLAAAYPALEINGHRQQRLPNTCSAAFVGLRATDLLAAMPGVAASAGAACHADGVSVSAVLTAMGVSQERAVGTVRMSVGRFSTEPEVDAALAEVRQALSRLLQNG